MITIIVIPFGLQTQDFPRGLCAIGQLVKKDGIPATTTQLILKLNLNPNARFKSAIQKMGGMWVWARKGCEPALILPSVKG